MFTPKLFDHTGDLPDEQSPPSLWPTWEDQVASLRNHPEWVRQLQAAEQRDKSRELVSLN
ncbi:MAG: hypothetical protein AAB671_02205 [Patescibacteria group bacterium]